MAPQPFPSMFLWPALAAQSASKFAAAVADELAGLAEPSEQISPVPPPTWTTPNRVALELPSMQLRDFSTKAFGTPTLICAPFALHGATIVDFAEGHSLVATLQLAGLGRVHVTDWRSATPEMRFLPIDSYLADLNVAVDELDGPVDLIGLCQGGWMALVYAARFPGKVRKLVLAGAPIDIAACESGLSRFTGSMPMSMFEQLVELGGGRFLGQRALGLWGPDQLDSNAAREVLQLPLEAVSTSEIEARFDRWYAWTVDLPGTYYLQVVDWLFKQNRLASGKFVALGRRIDLAEVRIPVFLLAARDDELVAPDQVFATERHVGTAPTAIEKRLAPCRHLGLFMGTNTLANTWLEIARFIGSSAETIAPSPKVPGD
jgi:poly(3-hydroxybutyrate) depolymerase